MFDTVIYTEGSISLEDSWNLDGEDRAILMESFEEYVKAKSPKGNNSMKQEQM